VNAAGERVGARAGTVRLADGRALAYAEWGPVDGRALLHFHGVPDGRFGWGAGPACEERGVRLIAVDRPGVGGSDPKPGRTVLDWTSDVEELVERLGIGRFGVGGHSAGGPYALACGRQLGDRVDSVALIGGAGRLDRPGVASQTHTARAWWLAARLPGVMAVAYTGSGRLTRRSPALALKLLAANFPPVDREVINRPEVAARLRLAYVEATRGGGGRGLAEDMRVLLAPWGFEPAEIGVPVLVFHGRRDAIAPLAHAEHWTETLADARPVWFEDAGHLLIEDHGEEILDRLAAHHRPAEEPDGRREGSRAGGDPA
jgi:pimeloyl-ACP methyl ester carboxylesterase